jgi:hypothetical protein
LQASYTPPVSCWRGSATQDFLAAPTIPSSSAGWRPDPIATGGQLCRNKNQVILLFDMVEALRSLLTRMPDAQAYEAAIEHGTQTANISGLHFRVDGTCDVHLDTLDKMLHKNHADVRQAIHLSSSRHSPVEAAHAAMLSLPNAEAKAMAVRMRKLFSCWEEMDMREMR